MKKKLLHNRISSAVLALVLVAAMCVSPLMSMSADASDDISAQFSVVAKENDVTVEATGKAIDMSEYFTINYGDEEAYVLYGTDSGAYYAAEADAYYAPYSDTIAVTYYTVAEDGTESVLDAAPSTAGTYKATAVLADTSYTYMEYDGGWVTVGVCYSQSVAGASINYQIVGEASGGDTGDEPDEPEEPNDGVVWFKANRTEAAFEEGAAIDLTEEFVLYWNEDPLLEMRDVENNNYYSKDAENRPEDGLLMEDAYTVCYYDADGNELASAPTKVGTYTAYAKLTSSSSYYWLGLYNWYPSKNVKSDAITVTVGDGISSTAGASIKYSGGEQTFTAGDEIDLSEYFTISYDGEEAFAVADVDGKYYYADYDPSYSDLLVIQWYDAEGTLMEGVPEEAGVYSVSAKLEIPVTAYAYENEAYTMLGTTDEAIESEKYKVTVNPKSSQPTAEDGELSIVFIGDTTEFEATGDPVDFSKDFTFEFRGAEPDLIFQGYSIVLENGTRSWIWGTGTDKDYRNFSNVYQEDGYEPYSDLYIVHYWDADGNELEAAPSEPGNYYVSADIPDISDDGGSRCIYAKYDWYASIDEHYFYYGAAESEKIPFTIKEAAAEKPADDNKADTKKDTKKDTVKTGDSSNVTLYLVMLLACATVFTGVLVQKRRRDF